MNHVRSQKLVDPDGNIAAEVVQTFVGDSELVLEATIAATVETQFNVLVLAVQIESVMLYGGGKALTVCTNGPKGGEHSNEFSVPAGGMVLWAQEDLTPNPFTSDVTSFFVTNEDATDPADVAIRVLQKTAVVP